MAKRRFSNVERYALWRAYDGRCFYCEKPLDFQNMTIDHIVPEWLSEHPQELWRLRREYEIDSTCPNFQINDFGNWAPACPHRCNGRKGAQVFPKKLTLLLLQEAQRRLGRVHQEVEILCGNRSRGHLFGSLGAAIENKRLSVGEVREFIANIEREQHTDEPLVLTFSLTTQDSLKGYALPSDVPHEYPYLCDWLELDLVRHLRSIITTPFHYTQPSERSGEGLSVRIVFPGLDDAQLERFSRPWWEIVEAACFWEIFGERYTDAFPDPPTKEYFGDLGEN